MIPAGMILVAPIPVRRECVVPDATPDVVPVATPVATPDVIPGTSTGTVAGLAPVTLRPAINLITLVTRLRTSLRQATAPPNPRHPLLLRFIRQSKAGDR